MFYRATEKSDGSGLGLYIVKEIVSKLKGSIKIESEKGIGTKVHLELPHTTKTSPSIKSIKKSKNPLPET